jgi:hypothetical protein
MHPETAYDRMDRHALVIAIWVAFGFAAVVLTNYGLGSGGAMFLFAGAGSVILGFLGHVIVNAVYGTTFTPRELALALIVYVVCLISFGVATLFDPDFASRNFLALSANFIVIGGVVITYMILHFGVRRTFQAFDVIRDFGNESRSSAPGAEK